MANEEPIRSVVLDILKDADMDNTTEFKVRRIAAEKLGFDLNTSAYKKLVRKTVEEFLIAKAEVESGANDRKEEAAGEDEAAEEEQEEEVEEEEQEQRTQVKRNKPPVPKERGQSGARGQSGDQFICQLSNKRNVSIQEWRGKKLISIREYYEKNGDLLPTSKGISLSIDQWEAFKRSVPAIEDAIRQLQ